MHGEKHAAVILPMTLTPVPEAPPLREPLLAVCQALTSGFVARKATDFRESRCGILPGAVALTTVRYMQLHLRLMRQRGSLFGNIDQDQIFQRAQWAETTS